LVNQQPSNFVLDGADEEGSDLQTNISAPNARKIKNFSKVAYTEKIGKDKEILKLKRTRYIKGCDSIDIEEQDKSGYVPNPVNDTFWILNGKATVIESGSDIGLYRFLKSHEGNVSNQNRPEGAVDIFREIDTSVDTLEVENIFDDEIKVLKYMDRLKRKVAGNIFEYSEDALEFLCSIFKIPPFQNGYRSDAWVAVAIYAKQNPGTFLSMIANKTAKIESDVNAAISKGIISIDEEKSFFSNSQKVITSFPKTFTNDDIKEKLVDFFANPSNREYYDELNTESLKIKIDKTAVVG
jgi:hypothetical protein